MIKMYVFIIIPWYFISSKDEYKLCHDAVAEYLLNDCVYGNC